MTLYAFDGTGNSWGGRKSTLVFDTAMSYKHGVTWKDNLAPGERRDVFYLPGVGTRMGIFGLIFGGLTGLGAKRRARQAYQHLCEQYAKPDATTEDLMIDVIGFSRGGATALHFTNLIRHLGIRKPRPSRPNTWRPYRIGPGWIFFRDWEQYGDPQSRSEEWRDRLPADIEVRTSEGNVIPKVRFVGLWDAVGSFGIPIDTKIANLQTMQFGFNLVLPPNVARCSHAMALDERRKGFRNLRVLESKRLTLLRLEQKMRFQQCIPLLMTLALAGLVAWPLGLLDDATARTIYLGVCAFVFGCGVMLGTFDAPAKERWPGMLGAILVSTCASAFMLLHVVVQWLGGRPINGPVVYGTMLISMLFTISSGLIGDIAKSGRLPRGPVAMARANVRFKGRRWLEIVETVVGTIWYTMLLALAIPLGLLTRTYSIAIGAGDRATSDIWFDQKPVVKEVWFRGNHTDVGGGGTPELVQISHAWMCAQARLADPPLTLADNPPVDVEHPEHHRVSDKFDPFPNRTPRRILDGDLSHPSVVPAVGDATSERFVDRLRFAATSAPTAPYPARQIDVRETDVGDIDLRDQDPLRYLVLHGEKTPEREPGR